MFATNRLVYFLGVFICQIYLIQGCVEILSRNQSISDNYEVRGSTVYHECWMITNPEKKYLIIHVLELNLMKKPASAASLTINIKDEHKTVTYWSQSVLDTITTTSSTIQIDFTVRAGEFPDGHEAKFLLYLSTKSVDCSSLDSFRCSNDFCIRKSQVCNGIVDCENGSDEVRCGIMNMKDVAYTLDREVEWIKSKRTTSWGWEENTPRILSALYLAGNTTFDGTNLEDELMVKQAKLIATVGLMRSSLSSEHLSMLITGLLVTCHNPRHFFGQNLIERLREDIELSNLAHPITYLTLCNANESWPTNATEDLNKILSRNISSLEFIKDYQAFAVMALSCSENQNGFLSKNENANMKTKYDQTIQRFKRMQHTDGSFGNLHTTALLTQALISSGQETDADWNVDASVEYIIEKLKMPHDLLASYLVLPILNAKSLTDLAQVNCSSNPQKKGYDDLGFETNYYDGPKIRVQYSVYLGEEKEIIHTISLLAPVNFTAFEVMEYAAYQDYKFSFKHKAMYVYQIGEVTNDSEAGFFWFLYKGLINSTNVIERLNIGPDKVVMQNGEHLVLWYKKFSF